MRGGIFPDEHRRRREAARADRGRAVDGRASTSSREVTPAAPLELEPTGGRRGGPTIALIDTGVKTSIVANLRARGARLRRAPGRHARRRDPRRRARRA